MLPCIWSPALYCEGCLQTIWKEEVAEAGAALSPPAQAISRVYPEHAGALELVMAPPALRPGSTLFAVNSSGRVLSLARCVSCPSYPPPREEVAWRELEYLGLEFKRVSAAANVLWAIGGDHEVGPLVHLCFDVSLIMLSLGTLFYFSP
jgi:hypothetical protein